MIDAEKLLGKVLAGAMQGKVKKGKKRKRSSDNLVGSLVGGLASGKGLITAIGLGVGAYEILRQSSALAGGGAAATTPRPATAPPPRPGVPPAAPPPLPPQHGAVVPPAVEPVAAAGSDDGNHNREQELAMRLIRVMVAAAHADGRLDEQEEQRILEKLQEQGLSREERLFLLQELHAPKEIAELAAGINGPMIAQTMYSLAVSTIVIDTPEERQWLDQLAAALSLSAAMQQFIEQDAV
jgi:uncharacterized membrane protein YebE (DUF533 family)